METKFLSYDQMTWPEVVSLPPDTPLIIPLGEGHPLNLISEKLGNPQHVGLLPAIPFGWSHSGLPVHESLLGNLLGNLFHCLQEDGFTRVDVLPDPGPAETAWLPAEVDRNKVVIIPIGHTEQHAYHLPLSTDTLIIEAIGQGTAAAIPDMAVCLPVFPYGVSTHRSSFGGTLNVGGRAFEDFWLGVIDTLVERGFDKFYFISGHGGNSSFLVNIVKYAGERHRRVFCATAWLYLSGPHGIASLERHRNSPIGGMGHACELETSLMLHLRPDLVHMDKVVDELDFIATPSYYMDWVEGGALIANPPWDDDTLSGAYGAGSQATAEKGKLWLEAAIAEKATHVQEIHQQQARREARRQAGFGLWGR